MEGWYPWKKLTRVTVAQRRRQQRIKGYFSNRPDFEGRGMWSSYIQRSARPPARVVAIGDVHDNKCRVECSGLCFSTTKKHECHQQAGVVSGCRRRSPLQTWWLPVIPVLLLSVHFGVRLRGLIIHLNNCTCTFIVLLAVFDGGFFPLFLPLRSASSVSPLLILLTL